MQTESSPAVKSGYICLRNSVAATACSSIHRLSLQYSHIGCTAKHVLLRKHIKAENHIHTWRTDSTYICL
jgi:hypothetical protein